MDSDLAECILEVGVGRGRGEKPEAVGMVRRPQLLEHQAWVRPQMQQSWGKQSLPEQLSPAGLGGQETESQGSPGG